MHLLNSDSLNAIERAIAMHVGENGFDRASFREMLDTNGMESARFIKPYLVIFFLKFVRFIMDDHYLSEDERTTAGLLRLLFRIDGPDFLGEYAPGVSMAIQQQLRWIYRAMPGISFEDACENTGLQEVFALSYDRYMQLAEACRPYFSEADPGNI